MSHPAIPASATASLCAAKRFARQASREAKKAAENHEALVARGGALELRIAAGEAMIALLKSQVVAMKDELRGLPRACDLLPDAESLAEIAKAAAVNQYYCRFHLSGRCTIEDAEAWVGHKISAAQLAAARLDVAPAAVSSAAPAAVSSAAPAVPSAAPAAKPGAAPELDSVSVLLRKHGFLG